MKERKNLRPTVAIDWPAIIPESDWAQYQLVLDAANEIEAPFALGGGLAFSEYSGHARNTKDLDLFIRPTDSERLIAAVSAKGFSDYHDQLEYDRTWLYRAVREGVIVDLIWSMPNHRLEVDDLFFDRGREIELYGERLRLIPLEEMIRTKLYVMQRDRCDWPDLLNVLNATVGEVDWDHLVARLGKDVPLLTGLVSIFRWMCPRRAAQIPISAYRRLGLEGWELGLGEAPSDERRDYLLDTRDWFGPCREV